MRFPAGRLVSGTSVGFARSMASVLAVLRLGAYACGSVDKSGTSATHLQISIPSRTALFCPVGSKIGSKR
jgi:hypothetical protein